MAVGACGAAATGGGGAAHSTPLPFQCNATLPKPSSSTTQVVHEWARGTPFKQICELTDVMEGSIVRAMVRLDETCRQGGAAFCTLLFFSVFCFVFFGGDHCWLWLSVLRSSESEQAAQRSPTRAPPTPPAARREFRDAARVMGNTALFQQMDTASAAIKRDCIFAQSLYTS